jgi:hypothetical protein
MTAYKNGTQVLWKGAVAAALMMTAGLRVAAAEEKPTMKCIVLEGTPEEVGRAFAQLNGKKIKADFERFMKDHKDLPKTGKRYVEITKKLAPHWLAEAAAVAKEIGVDPTLYGIYLGAKYRGVNAGHECVSYAAAAKVTKDGKALLHKLRQNRFRLQGAFFKKIVFEGKSLHKFFRVGDVHGLEPCMFVNEKGLASCHVQCGRDPQPRWEGWMNHSLSRYIAENASTCQEALDILEMTCNKEYYAGGKIGTRWTFADASGNIVTALQHARAVSKIDWAKEKGFVRNKDDFPSEDDLPLDALAMNNALRKDKYMEKALSSLTAEVPREHPEFLTCAWVSFGRPSSVYVPLLMGGRGTPASIADGTLHSLNRSVDRRTMASGARVFEKQAEEEKQRVERQVTRLLKEGKKTDAVEMLTDFNVKMTLAAEELAKNMKGATEEQPKTDAGAVVLAPLVNAREMRALSLPKDFVPLGKISPRHARDIKGSNWSVGAETMGRNYTVYKHWRAYLGPLGVKSARVQSGWAKTERKKGVYDWAWMDEIIPDMVDQGVKPWVCLCYGNPIYAGGGNESSSSKLPSSREALNAWDSFVKAFVRRYGKYVDEWEIWNEPQHKKNSVSDYAELFIRTAEIIRSEQPKARIFALSAAGVRVDKFRPFLGILKRKGKLALVNSVTFHPYTLNPESTYKTIKRLRAAVHSFSGDITLFQGENGAPSTKSTYGALSGASWTEISQAKWLLRRLLGDLGHDIRSSYFSIVDMHYVRDGKLRMNTKGLISTNPDKTVKRPKLSYRAYQNITAVFDSTLHRVPKVAPPRKPANIEMFAYQTTPSKGHAAKSVVCVWRGGRMPSNRLRMSPLTLDLPNSGLEEPIFVDMLSGSVYAIGKERISRNHDRLSLKDIPVGDWPILIADSRAFVWNREPEERVSPNKGNRGGD